MNGWHFLADTGLLRNGDQPPANGQWLVHKGRLVPGKSGLHFSEHPFSALDYAHGSVLCRVVGRRLQGHGKPTDSHICRQRKILWRRDVAVELLRFACDFALDVQHLWDMPSVTKQYLLDPIPANRAASQDAATQDAAVRSSAPASAAATASWAASQDAAWEAARDTAWFAAWATVRSTVRSTVRDAAWAAAWATARNGQRQRFLTACGLSE